MAFSFLFFVVIGGAISVIDYKKHIISDRLSIPSFAMLLLIRFWERGNIFSEIAAVFIVLAIFLILLYFFADFGGGDLRFGALCAALLGARDMFLFFVIAGLLHLLLLLFLKTKVAGFAPAMFAAAVVTHLFSAKIWSML
ncbi:MAG: prepilin peptidase [Campylobacteraceae bacterium]|nr:prepilin peptidase [Campylobacteraceae bacterium]